MVFANLFFLCLFFPLNLAFYYSSRNLTYRNAVLVAFSLFFYAWGEPVWITLLLFSAAIDYFHGLYAEKHRGTAKAKWAVASSLVLNLGLLGIFKYSGFLVSTVNSLLGLSLPVPGFSLPIGISFYTFQTISYVIDVYRGEVKAQKSFGKFLLFVSCYHQLVAGPIVRYSQVAEEIENRKVTIHDFSDGLTRFCLGLSKKVIVANYAGSLVGRFMDGDLSALSVAGAWYGIILFALQIYFDFSGYSDMAIGLGRMFGFHYAENFNYPYISTSATEFWRRWHMSLGGFFRDYLYIPLGGSRHGAARTYINTFIVWFATGLWHGASWNFVLWGLFYGLLIMIEKAFLLKVLDRLPAVFSHLYFLVIMLTGWVFFYFTDMSRVWAYLGVMFGLSGNPVGDVSTRLLFFNNIFWFLLAIAFCLPLVRWFKRYFSNLESRKQDILLYVQPVMNVILLMVCIAQLAGQSYNPFLYFRF